MSSFEVPGVPDIHTLGAHRQGDCHTSICRGRVPDIHLSGTRAGNCAYPTSTRQRVPNTVLGEQEPCLVIFPFGARSAGVR